MPLTLLAMGEELDLEPIFEADFADFSYGFRPKRNAHDALQEVYKWLNFGCHWVVDVDLKGYFDTIPHNKLLALVRERVTDKAVIKLLKMWLLAGVMEKGKTVKSSLGTPQGGASLHFLQTSISMHLIDSG